MSNTIESKLDICCIFYSWSFCLVIH